MTRDELTMAVARALKSFSCHLMGMKYCVLPRGAWLQKDSVFKSVDQIEALKKTDELNAAAALSAIEEAGFRLVSTEREEWLPKELTEYRE